MEKSDIERFGFGVVADKDELPLYFTHSDRFLVVDLKLRKEVIWREYRPNPYAEICREKYSMPSVIGDNPCDEEVEIYRQIAEIVKDCKYVQGKSFGNYAANALKAAGSDAMMVSFHEAQEWIDSLIEARSYAGYRD